MNGSEGTIGDFRFGLDSEEAHARFQESLTRQLESFNEWGELPAGTTFIDVVDALVDTLGGWGGMAAIPATELPGFLEDALDQLRGDDD